MTPNVSKQVVRNKNKSTTTENTTATVAKAFALPGRLFRPAQREYAPSEIPANDGKIVIVLMI